MKIKADVNSKQDHAQCRPKVFFGKVLLTAGVYDGIPVADVVTALHRHRVGDWGHVSDEDREENELSLREGFRLLSVYYSRDGVKFWIITEADRSSTTVLLPEEY